MKLLNDCKRLYLFCYCLINLFSGSALAQFTVDEILVNGPTDQRINIVFLAEGYTESELTKFARNSKSALTYLLGIKPWSSYYTYFNAYRINVISNESGSDHPATAADEPDGYPEILKDTYFNSSYDSWRVHRLLTLPPHPFDWDASNGIDKVYEVLANLFPEYDMVFLIVNSELYGGSGGRIAIFSVNSASWEIAAHEVGHSFAHLDDEYDYGNKNSNPDIWPNTTRETSREIIKWNTWIAPSTPLPTPEIFQQYGALIGLFEGANHSPTEWYRPKYQCRMKHLYVPFCEVCKESIVLEYYSLLHPILSFNPQQTSLTIRDNEVITFSVETLNPISHNLEMEWQIDGYKYAGVTGTVFQLHGSELTIGDHTIAAIISDPTESVRNDPNDLLKDTQSWLVVKKQPLACLNNGDVDADGILTHGDTQCAFRIFLNGQIAPLDCVDEHSDCQNIAAEVNCNEIVTPGDALAIFRRFRDSLPPADCFAQEGMATAEMALKTNPYHLSLNQPVFMQSNSGEVRNILKVALVIENPDALDAFGLNIMYPADTLEFLGVERTFLTADWIQLDGQSNEDGVLTIGGFNDVPLTKSGSGELFNLVFAYKDEIVGSFDFKITNLVDDFHNATAQFYNLRFAGLTSKPAEFKLYQNYQNPFNAGTRIRFDIPAGIDGKIRVRFSIYNLSGQLVQVLMDEERSAGTHEIVWDGRNATGAQVPSGLYIYQISAGEFQAANKMLVLK